MREKKTRQIDRRKIERSRERERQKESKKERKKEIWQKRKKSGI